MRNIDLARKNLEEEQPVRTKTVEDGKRPFAFIAMGLILLISALILLLALSRKQPQQGETATQDARLNALEHKIVQLEIIDSKISRLEELFKDYAVTMMDRVDRLEKTLGSAIKHQTEAGNQIGKILPAESPEREKKELAPQPSGGQAKLAYHEVMPGETLYRISLRYGMSVEGLMKLNDLKEGAIITVGQRLRVNPEENR
ncbi:MAG: LysM peptidoglycan-binding domain-containing protein [Deltaproteobacteria bacterium]|nr:LysM peptidoglycan-binding domain-containing protein [Deltaproteobacteria bacterium]